MSRPAPNSIDRPMSPGRRVDRGAGRRSRRRSRLAWLVALSFAFMQLVLPAYACALAMPLVMEDFLEQANPEKQVVAGESCDHHQPHDSPLCFKHCHPEDGSSGVQATGIPALTDTPAILFAELSPARVGTRLRTTSPGIPPPIAISFCRLQR